MPHFNRGKRGDGDETPAVWKDSTEITERTESGMHCQEGTDAEAGQEKDRWGFISDLNSHFRVALCPSLFCMVVEFKSKYKHTFWSA